MYTFRLRNNFLHISISAILLGSSIIHAAAQTPDSDGNNVTLDLNARKEIVAFLDACREKAIGNEEQAAAKFLEVLDINPTNHAANYELAVLLSNKKKFKQALFTIDQAIKYDNQNVWYIEKKGDILSESGALKEAIKTYEKVTKLQPSNLEALYKISDNLLLLGKYTDAIEVYDKMERIVGVDEQLSIQKQKIWLQLNKLDKAEEEIKRLIASNPAEIRYLNILAELYRANNQPEKAYEVYKKIEAISPDEAFLNMQLADYYRIKGDKEKSFSYLKRAFLNRNLDVDTKMKVLLSYYSLSENNSQLKSQAYELLDALQEAHYNDAKVYAVYGDFLYRDSNWKEAKEKYAKCLSIDKSKYPVWSQYLIILSELKLFSELENASTEAIEVFPIEAFSYLLKGIAQQQQKKYSESIPVLIKGLKMSFDNAMSVQFLSSLGDAFNEVKQHERSDSAYYEALKLDPNNATVLNNLSYYLSLRKKDLEKAKEMSKKSNDLEPNNASFLDTYGWILFQMGNYSEAKVWIQKAIAAGGENNGTLIEHLGDAEAKLGNTEKALELWNKALQTGDVSPTIQQKIKQRTYLE